MEETRGFVRVLGYRMSHRSLGTATKGTVLCLHGGPRASHSTSSPSRTSPRPGIAWSSPTS